MDKLHNKTQGGYRPVPIKGFRPPQPNDNWPYHGQPTTPNDREYGIKNPKFERHIFVSSENVFFDIDSQLGMLAKSRRKSDGTEDDAAEQQQHDQNRVHRRNRPAAKAQDDRNQRIQHRAAAQRSAAV